MTTELEQEFFDIFEIEPEYTYIGHYPLTDEEGIIQPPAYPEITAEKLLELICIWNYIMPCIDDCIIPIDYLGLKSVVLDKMIRYSEIEYEFDVNALKYQIKQLFKV